MAFNLRKGYTFKALLFRSIKYINKMSNNLDPYQTPSYLTYDLDPSCLGILLIVVAPCKVISDQLCCFFAAVDCCELTDTGCSCATCLSISYTLHYPPILVYNTPLLEFTRKIKDSNPLIAVHYSKYWTVRTMG